MSDDANYLGSMGKALLVHQHALKLLKIRMSDVSPTGMCKATIPGLEVTGKNDRLLVTIDYPFGAVRFEAYQWYSERESVFMKYAPEHLDAALNYMQRAMVLDELADV